MICEIGHSDTNQNVSFYQSRFIHYRRTGEITLELARAVAAVTEHDHINGIPFCKEYLNGKCSRGGNRCRYWHIDKKEERNQRMLEGHGGGQGVGMGGGGMGAMMQPSRAAMHPPQPFEAGGFPGEQQQYARERQQPMRVRDDPVAGYYGTASGGAMGGGGVVNQTGSAFARSPFAANTGATGVSGGAFRSSTLYGGSMGNDGVGAAGGPMLAYESPLQKRPRYDDPLLGGATGGGGGSALAEELRAMQMKVKEQQTEIESLKRELTRERERYEDLYTLFRQQTVAAVHQQQAQAAAAQQQQAPSVSYPQAVPPATGQVLTPAIAPTAADHLVSLAASMAGTPILHQSAAMSSAASDVQWSTMRRQN